MSVVLTLTTEQVDYLKSLTRQDIRKRSNKHKRMQAKFGDAFDSTKQVGSVEFRENVYRALGGEPSRIGTAQTQDERFGETKGE